MDAFGGNDEESAELKKLNAEVVSKETDNMRSYTTCADRVGS